MATLSLLTVDDVHKRSTIDIVKNNSNLEFYIDVAENLLDAQELNIDKTGYSINVGYAVLKLVEYLVINDQEHILQAIAGNFAEERMGSYSYKIKELEDRGWPPLVDRIITMYRGIGVSAKMLFSTRVFPEFKPSTLTGYRPVHDYRDDEFYKKEADFRPQP